MRNLVFTDVHSSKESLSDREFVSVESLCPIKRDGRYFVDAIIPPFELGGIVHPKDNCGEFYRLDASKKEVYSNDNRNLAACTQGANIRFITDAETVTVSAKLRAAVLGMQHFCNRGVYGFDLYVGSGTDRHYVGKQMQFMVNTPEHMEDTLELGPGLKEVMLNFPLYGGVEQISFGFSKGDKVAAPTKRQYGDIAFYGSSITQGGCVSRPSNAYTNIVCRALDANCKGFGFSGSAMGETEVAEYIASQKLAAFVMDYDYNAITVDDLKNTHYNFYKVIRDKQPDLPIIFVTHPIYSDPTEDDFARFAVVKDTYFKAISEGDRRVWFVDSMDFFSPQMRDLYAVDNLHPNDLGQLSMAEVIYPVVKKALESAENR